MALSQKPRKKTRQDFDLWRGMIVKVVWLDPLSCGEATEAELAKEPDILFTTYGEIISKNKNLTLASTTANEPRDRLLREIVRIPVSLVKSVVLLEATKEELKL